VAGTPGSPRPSNATSCLISRKKNFLLPLVFLCIFHRSVPLSCF
jgi:hypothetical protein